MASEHDLIAPPVAKFQCSGVKYGFHSSGMSFLEIKFLPVPLSMRNSCLCPSGSHPAIIAAMHLNAVLNTVGRELFDLIGFTTLLDAEYTHLHLEYPALDERLQSAHPCFGTSGCGADSLRAPSALFNELATTAPDTILATPA